MNDADFTRLHGQCGAHEIVKGAASALLRQQCHGRRHQYHHQGAETLDAECERQVAKHNEQRYGASFGLNSKHWNNMFTANFNCCNYDVHSAEIL